MTKQVQRRRGTATQHTSFTGAEGELSVNTTNKSVHVHDNVTAGGFEAARADMDNVTSSSILTAAGITATTTELNYVDGVTSAIQTQLDGKAGTASPTFTGTLTTANLTATGTTTLAGASTSADITFGDNDKAIFGAGSDLQIYHDGANSYVEDAGAGSLVLKGANVLIRDISDNNIVKANDGGSAVLFYAGASKLATTSTGVDVTGTITSDGLTVNGNATIQQDDALIFIKETDGTNIAAVGDLTGAGQGGAFYYDHGGTATIQLKSYEASTIENGLNVKGDISFYEDTGTTPKFFWDASAERLGIGTSSPEGSLHLNGSFAGRGLVIDLATEGVTDNVGTFNAKHSAGVLAFQTNSTERMRITSSGSVGIGTSSPVAPLHVIDKSLVTGTAPQIRFNPNANDASDDDRLILGLATGSGQFVGGSVAGDSILRTTNGGNLLFGEGTTERMRIDSSGNVGIGNSNPSAFNSLGASDKLVIGDSTDSNLTLFGTTYGSLAFADSDASSSTAQYAGLIQYYHADNSMQFYTGSTERMRIDSSGAIHLSGTIEIANGTGNVGVGVDALRANTGDYNTGIGVVSGYSLTGGDNNTFLGFAAGYGSTGSRNTFVGARNGTLGSGQSMTTGNANTILGGFSGDQHGLDIRASHNNIVLSDGDGNPRVRVASDGRTAIGTEIYTGYQFNVSSANAPLIGVRTSSSDGDVVASFTWDTSGYSTVLYVASSGAGPNGAATAFKVGRNNSTSRSINASGTINASGADCAEYMVKADTSATINKGDVCGIDVNGKLTTLWADAISFVVKSTDPSYVGGDTWFNDEERPNKDKVTAEEYAAFEARLEAARAKVDRIAFSGQVPVNVTGATVGDFIIPVQDGTGITGQAVSSPTLEQYMSAVGKVIAIEDDGRAKIIVKVA